MAGPVVLGLGVLLVVVAATATVTLLDLGSWVDRCVTWYVVALTAVVAAVAVVGLAGWLRPGPLLAVQGVQALLPVLVLRRRGRLGASGLARWPTAWPGLRRAAVRGSRELRRAPWEWSLVVLAGVALAWELVVALVLPQYAYDALSYHLVHVATWVQQESLAPPSLSACCGYYPGNAELPSLWTAVLLGSDHLVGSVQVAAAAAGAAAVAGIGRSAGLDRRAAAAAGALFLLTPALLAQAPTAYVDVLQSALVVCALHGLARFAAGAQLGQLLVPTLAAALLTGTKGHGLLWAAVLGVTAVVTAVVHVRRGRLAARRAGAGLATGLVACGLLGGWWFLRNAVETGNPLYPLELRVAGRTLLEGRFGVGEVLPPPPGGPRPRLVEIAASWASDLRPWRHGVYSYEQRSGGLGPVWSWLGVLSVPLLVVLVRRRSPVLAAVVPPFVVLLVQPSPWWARFTLPLAAVGAVAVVWAVRRLRRPWLRRVLQGFVLALVGLGTLLVVAVVNPASRAPVLPSPHVVGLIGSPASERTLGRLFLPEYAFLDEVPASATLVVDLDAPEIRFTYPLFGRHFDRTVLGWRPGAGAGVVRDDAWVVTARGRPLDDRMVRQRPGPVSDVRGVRVWAPLR